MSSENSLQPDQGSEPPETISEIVQRQIAKRQKNPQQVQEQPKEKIDLKTKLDEFVGKFPSRIIRQLDEYKWPGTSKKWVEGFYEEYLQRNILKRGNFGINLFKDFVKDLKKNYEDVRFKSDPDKERMKAQYEIAKDMLELLTGEREKEEIATKETQLTKLKSTWGLENIKNSFKNALEQLREFFGTIFGTRKKVYRVLDKTPGFDETANQNGAAEIEKEALKGSSQEDGSARLISQAISEAQAATSTVHSEPAANGNADVVEDVDHSTPVIANDNVVALEDAGHPKTKAA